MQIYNKFFNYKQFSLIFLQSFGKKYVLVPNHYSQIFIKRLIISI